MGSGNDVDSKVSGRWSRGEHDKFIEGNYSLYLVRSVIDLYLNTLIQEFKITFLIAMRLYGKDWKKVETHIGTRSGAQIRSHAQKFFNRVEKEFGENVEEFLESKAESIKNRKGLNSSVHNEDSH